ncbi:MAG: hypothetical protein ACE5HA_05885 [Anaerolineae bacterium]
MQLRAVLVVGSLLAVTTGMVVLTSESHSAATGHVSQAESASAWAMGAVKQTAPPPLPASFYGTVTVNGADAPEGTPVSAWIDGIRYATTDAFIFDGRSMYAMDVPGDDPATPEVDGGRPGDTIVFHVGGLKAGQTATWQGGTNTALDLTVTRWRVLLPLVLEIGD